ncbi:hypothetical protein [Streptomyces sp. NBC_01022]|uniref:hypothetical protein n=1 Tax=Streptomyces sp. NBC_01022 TaxID=2903723 RepID=UPI002DDAE83D|nr:hypothetical protein [Streptomyces sp. NBC_01022]WRZ84372.1 hypothetical protein OG316_30985 [Streptomyces sp. NBC_01022]
MRTVLRVPVVLMALAIGAAGVVSCGSSTPEKTAASAPTTASGQPTAAAAKTAAKPSATPDLTPASALPKHAVAGKDRPSIGAGVTMAAGYTGKDYLSRLAKNWSLDLGKPVKQEMPNGKMRTYIHGRGTTGKGTGTTVSAGFADHTNLSSLLCGTGTDQPGALDFLSACTGLDVAGIDHAKASSWVEQAKRETDSLYKERAAETKNKKEYVVSGVLTSGPVVMVLHRTYDTYSLRILGNAAA